MRVELWNEEEREFCAVLRTSAVPRSVTIIRLSSGFIRRRYRSRRETSDKEQRQVRAGEEDHARPGYWVDNVKTWTGLRVEVSVRMTEDRDKWRKYVHGVANRRVEDG